MDGQKTCRECGTKLLDGIEERIGLCASCNAQDHREVIFDDQDE